MAQTATAIEVINAALRLLQVKGDDVTLSANEANDALFALNSLFDSWSNDNLMLYDIVRESFSLTAGKNPHTWGIGGDFNSERPMKLNTVNIMVGSTEWPVRILTDDDYAAIRLKTLQTNYAQYCWLEQSYPLANLWIYPVPGSGNTLITYSEKPLTQIASLTTSITMPPGYIRMLRYNLAVELASEYQLKAGDDVVRIAIESKNALQRQNRKPKTLQVDQALLSMKKNRYNIYTDGYNT